jgi:hypothetical protein
MASKGDERSSKKDFNEIILGNLQDRRSGVNQDLYRVFFLRYLSPKIREIVWKGILLDQIELQTYEENIKYDKTYSVNKDEMYILKICNQIIEEKFHSMGKDYDMIMLFKAIMIYVTAYLNVYLQDFHYYLLVPLIYSFKSYRTYT